MKYVKVQNEATKPDPTQVAYSSNQPSRLLLTEHADFIEQNLNDGFRF